MKTMIVLVLLMAVSGACWASINDKDAVRACIGEPQSVRVEDCPKEREQNQKGNQT